jgi:hypothetical protein
MFGLDFYEIVIILALLALAARKQRNWFSGPALVLKKFSINKTATGQVPIIDIIGRQSGLITWFLTLIGLDTTSSLKVTATDFSLRDTSLFGQQHSVIALSSISSVHCGYRKPVVYLFISAACLLLGLEYSLKQWGSLDLITILFLFCGFSFMALIFFVLYFLKKKHCPLCYPACRT